METVTIIDLAAKIATSLGMPGVLFLVWYLSDRRYSSALAQYRNDMVEQRRMYENNVELVKSYAQMANGLQSMIVLSTQTLTRLCDKIDGNQYCPQVRLKKQAEGRQE
jgi:hypothetical protein